MFQRGLRDILMAALLAAALLAAGCGRGMVAAENPAPVDRARYEPLFESSVQTLRAMGFTVDRRDRRFGVITTEPRTSPSIFEPWFGDNTTGEQTLASTLNHRRRVIRIEIQPRGDAGGEGAADSGGDSGGAGDSESAGRGDYQLRVTADVQQRVVPNAELTTAAVRPITLRDRRVPRRIRLTERGPAETFWRGIGRDPHLERRLVHAILQRAAPAEQRGGEEDQSAAAPGNS